MAVARPQPGTTQDSEHTPEAVLPYLAGLVASDGNIQSREARIATSVMPFLHMVHNFVEAFGIQSSNQQSRRRFDNTDLHCKSQKNSHQQVQNTNGQESGEDNFPELA